MIKSEDRLEAIKNLIQYTGLNFYKEVVFFIDQYLEGKLDKYLLNEKYLDNRIVAQKLDIKKYKASKVLSNLQQIGVVIRKEKNRYKLIHPTEFRNLVYQWSAEKVQSEIENLNLIYNKKLIGIFYENLDLINGLEHYINSYNSVPPNQNLYNEYNISEFLFTRPWMELTEIDHEIIKSTLSKYFYEKVQTFFSKVIDNLEKTIEQNLPDGNIYFIIYLKSIEDLFHSSHLRKRKRIAKNLKNFLINSLQSIKNTITGSIFENFILTEHKLKLIIDLDHNRFNGPISIFGPYVYFAYTKPIFPIKSSILYFYNKEISRIYVNNYLSLFNSLIQRQSEDIDDEKDLKSLSEDDIGVLLYDNAILMLERKIKYVNKL
jgi:hypothetical protein